jgi:hypothetical protein
MVAADYTSHKRIRVNGKISLLKKHGTGEPTRTGAYELYFSIGTHIVA